MNEKNELWMKHDWNMKYVLEPSNTESQRLSFSFVVQLSIVLHIQNQPIWSLPLILTGCYHFWYRGECDVYCADMPTLLMSVKTHNKLSVIQHTNEVIDKNEKVYCLPQDRHKRFALQSTEWIQTVPKYQPNTHCPYIPSQPETKKRKLLIMKCVLCWFDLIWFDLDLQIIKYFKFLYSCELKSTQSSLSVR